MNVTIDFETYGIDQRPEYPPEPVGVGIKEWGRSSKYYAWGHPSGNNCTKEQAIAVLQSYWDNPCNEFIFHNAKFDYDVATTKLGLSPLPWHKIHDTMLLLFLDDPNQAQLSLKPSADRLLGMAPEEQDAVFQYLVKNQHELGVKVSPSKNSNGHNNFGRYICLAPGDLVGQYGMGDVIRTEVLFQLLYPRIAEHHMLNAYDRERKLMMALLKVERHGMRIDYDQLGTDLKSYTDTYDMLTGWIQNYVHAGPSLNVDSGAELMDALSAAGLIDVSQVPVTRTGKLSYSKSVFEHCLPDKLLSHVMQYRTQLGTCLHTFMGPWYDTASRSDGIIYSSWNQVKTGDSKTHVGARTGRLSSTPNFQNIPKKFHNPLEGLELSAELSALGPLPNVRSYIIPDSPDDVLIDRDYSQQELRILAHYDGGNLLEAYQADEWLDMHTYAQKKLAEMGYVYERKPVKTTNFGLIYGMGVGKLADKIGCSVEEAQKLKTALLGLYPGVKRLYNVMRTRARLGEPIKTWGGRIYYCEEAKMQEGKYRTFDYKMVNTLIQGSAADCTKEALIRVDKGNKPDWHILMNVHDQITESVPRKDIEEAMENLKSGMESVEFDVAMKSEGSWSDTNWAELKPYDEKGRKIYGMAE
jgi:DNA polymerase-1